MAYNCIIIDDEQPARKLLENYCGKMASLELIGSYKSALDALPIIKEQAIDLVFLDIQMPDISGLDFLKTMNSQSFHVVLTTAYREYALDGFELDVVDYLLKPISFPRFIKSINKLAGLGRQQSKVVAEQPIFLKSGKKTYKVLPSSILYIKSENEYIKYVTKTHNNLLVHGSIKSILIDLPEDFVRVHRSYIVNLKSISFIEGNSRIKINDIFIPISEMYRKDFLRNLMD